MSHLTPEVPPPVAEAETSATVGTVSAQPEEYAKKPTDHLYWARSSSANAAPPPKAISADEAKRLEVAASNAGGSAWNKGGNTWEEKKINQWAIDKLKEEHLPLLAYSLPSGSASLPATPTCQDMEGVSKNVTAKVRVASVDAVKGEATYVLSRGKQRVVFEIELKLSLEIEVMDGDVLKTIVTGERHGREETASQPALHALPRASALFLPATCRLSLT